MQKSVLDASRSLTIYDSHTHRVIAIGYLHYLPVKEANIFTHAPNFHVLSLLHTAYLFKVYDLTSQVTQFMQSIQFKPISNKHHLLNKFKKCFIKPLCKIKNQ